MLADAQTPDARGALRATGLKVTAGRIAVLDALALQPHIAAETVLSLVHERLPGTSVQSVHNILGDLVDAGLVRRFTPARQAARYERRVGDNHHHSVCSSCGRVDDVDCVVGAAPCLHAQGPDGFVVAAAEVTFVGICAHCLAAAHSRETSTAEPIPAVGSTGTYDRGHPHTRPATHPVSPTDQEEQHAHDE